MVTTKNEVLKTDISIFLENIGKLSKDYKIALIRSVGKSYAESSAKAKMGFIQSLPKKDINSKYKWFFVATIYCLYDCKSSETTFARALNSIDRNSTKMNFTHILDDTLSSDSLLLYKLTKLIKMLFNEGKRINLEQLLLDLIYWNSESGVTQEKWIMDYYSNNDIE